MDTLKILVVDDEPGIRSGVIRILQNHKVSYPFMDEDYNFEIMEAATGEDSIQIMESRMPDILLLDNKLPGIQGIDVLAYIKEKAYDVVVAMITSYASLDLAVKATGDGAFDFIPKPFTPAELKASIDNIVKQWYLRRITRNLKEESKKARYQFLTVLSHELKAPLNAIEGYLNLMKERQAGEDISAYDTMIDRSMNRITGMRNLIMNLLDFSKIRIEKRTDHFKLFSLNELALDAINTVQPIAVQKNVQIFVHSNKDVNLTADPDDFEIVLNNLLSNAVKYNEEGGRVDIVIQEENNFIEIQVEDTGIGMTTEEITNLFKEFVRIKNEKTRNIIGSGLGLSNVKKVIDLYEGSIRVESVPDQGTSFFVKFPKPVNMEK
jgi:two-component system, sensor histidine kinase and response regulator